jgi:hypothetical protein
LWSRRYRWAAPRAWSAACEEFWGLDTAWRMHVCWCPEH